MTDQQIADQKPAAQKAEVRKAVDIDTPADEGVATEELVARAAALGPDLAQLAERHDRDGSWVEESFQLLKDTGLLAIGVPRELGGGGATIRQLAMVQRELARHCASTALASAMHQHVTAFTAWRYRRGLPGAEATLRRIVEDGIVLVSTGGADYTHPRGTARKVEGGYRVSGAKIFASQAPAGTVMSTMFAYEDPERGMRVLNMAVPFASEGVAVAETWDAMGMRGTASHDVLLEDVFVPDERVLADRPYGVVDGPLQVISSIGFSVISGVYLGIAEAARDHAIAAVRDASDPVAQRQVGLMTHRARVAAWALDCALAIVGDGPVPSLETLEAVMLAKREIALAGVEIRDIAMEVAGGSGYFRGSPFERAYRDIRAAKFHPFTPEATLMRAGRAAFGLDVEVP